MAGGVAAGPTVGGDEPRQPHGFPIAGAKGIVFTSCADAQRDRPLAISLRRYPTNQAGARTEGGPARVARLVLRRLAAGCLPRRTRK
jgi:hypothetical protein